MYDGKFEKFYYRFSKKIKNLLKKKQIKIQFSLQNLNSSFSLNELFEYEENCVDIIENKFFINRKTCLSFSYEKNLLNYYDRMKFSFIHFVIFFFC